MYQILTLTILLVGLITDTYGDSCPDGWTASPLQPELCYYFVPQPNPNFYEARNICSQLHPNSDLPVLRNETEFDIFLQLTKTCLYDPDYYMWIGLAYINNNYVWLDGTALTYYNRWQKNFPWSSGTLNCVATWGWNLNMSMATRSCAAAPAVSVPATICNVSGLQQRGPSQNCSDGWISFNGICIKHQVCSDNSFSTAIQCCASENATLPMYFNGMQSVDYFGDLTLFSFWWANEVYPNDVWMGLYYVNNTWLWLNNVTFDLDQYWLPGQPSDAYCSTSQCGAVVHFNGSHWGLQVVDTSTALNEIICMKVPPVNDHTTSLSSSNLWSTVVETTTAEISTSTLASSSTSTTLASSSSSSSLSSSSSPTPTPSTSSLQSSSSSSSSSTTKFTTSSYSSSSSSPTPTPTPSTSSLQSSLSSSSSSTTKFTTTTIQKPQPTTTIAKSSTMTTTKVVSISEPLVVYPVATTVATVYDTSLTSQRFENETCQYSDWSAFSECSTTCGSGIKMRSKYAVECISLNESEFCSNIVPCNPMNAVEQVAAKTLSALGSLWIIGTNAACLVIFLLARSFSYERCLHVGQEITLALAQIIVLMLYERTVSIELCKFAAISLQFLYICYFCFLLAEIMQTFYIFSNVTSFGGFIKMKYCLIYCIGVPLLCTTFTTLSYMDHLTSQYSCWLNVDHRISMGTIFPVFLCCAISVVTLDSTYMWRYPNLPLINKDQFYSSVVSMHGCIFKLPLALVCWFTMSFAVFYQKFYLFPIVFGLNVGYAWTIFLFHVLGNDHVKQLLMKMWKTFTKKLKKSSK